MSARFAPSAFVIAFGLFGCATAAKAQHAPLPARAVQASIGVDSFGPPSVAVAFAPAVSLLGADVLVTSVVDAHAQSLTLRGGGQARQDLASWFFVREALVAGPLVSVVDGVAVGAGADAVVQAGFVVFGVTVAVGPVLDAAVVVDRAVTWRLSPGVGAAVVVPIIDPVRVVVDVDGGYDFGGVGEGAFAGRAFAGVQVSL
jgi:hypothetical protein